MLLKEIVLGSKTYQLLARHILKTNEKGKTVIFYQVAYTYIPTESLELKKRKSAKTIYPYSNNRITGSQVIIKTFEIPNSRSKLFEKKREELNNEHIGLFDDFVREETEKEISLLKESLEAQNN